MLISGASKQISSPRGILLNLSEYLFELLFTAISIQFIQSLFPPPGALRLREKTTKNEITPAARKKMQKTVRNAVNLFAKNSAKCGKLICKKQCEMR